MPEPDFKIGQSVWANGSVLKVVAIHTGAPVRYDLVYKNERITIRNVAEHDIERVTPTDG